MPESSRFEIETEGSFFDTDLNANRETETTIDLPEISLDFGHLGSGLLPTIDNLNEPYRYLPEEIEIELESIQRKFIFPILQDKIRRGETPLLIADRIAEISTTLDPKIMPVDSFLSLTNSVYRQKLTVQREIAMHLAMTDTKEGQSTTDIEHSFQLLNRSRGIEPYFFAVSQKTKAFIDQGLQRIKDDYHLYDEDELMLSTPAQASFYTHYLLDTEEYLNSSTRSNVSEELLSRRYFNGSIARMDQTIRTLRERRQTTRTKSELELQKRSDRARQDMHDWWLRKFYYLQERKLPYAADIDALLMLDNTVDKFLQNKNCSLHDLFLEIRTREQLQGTWLPWSVDKLPEQIAATLDQPLII